MNNNVEVEDAEFTEIENTPKKLATASEADFITDEKDSYYFDDVFSRERSVGNNKYHVPKTVARAKAKAQRKARAKARKK